MLEAFFSCKGDENLQQLKTPGANLLFGKVGWFTAVREGIEVTHEVWFGKKEQGEIFFF